MDPSDEIARLESVVDVLQKRLRDAGLDASIPDVPASNKNAADETQAANAQAEMPQESLVSIAHMDEIKSLKAEGNDLFRSQKYREAGLSYGKAMKIYTRADQPIDAKLLSNHAAAMLAIDKFVAAAFDGQRSMENDPTWWKGYWYRGQALMKMLQNKPPSTAMAERCEQAKIAFNQCLKCPTLPDNKRSEVEAQLKISKNVLMQMTTDCPQS
uniref:Uncharacterized protein n=1 Tax=Octactis speculum TaxID=3111310 RepID=A0A6U3SNV3_9STRA|mmetsp:Transcript_30970/g.41936  ORF Transcript_30970/g.41936 Transcript_30970/m.41936 type:complete len:213 (+) Transcript_30970:75-713(+)